MKKEYIFEITIRPVPASRPRVGKNGTYYTKTYSNFRKEMSKYLEQFKENKEYSINENCLFSVEFEFICPSPKKKTIKTPRGDLDNFMKGPLDCITYNCIVWKDDTQVSEITATKRFTEANESNKIKIKIKEL